MSIAFFIETALFILIAIRLLDLQAFLLFACSKIAQCTQLLRFNMAFK